MSQSSRQFKLTAKIQSKTHHKSSLPNIDPLHHTKSKFVTPSPNKPAFKNARKIGRNNQPASNINDTSLKPQFCQTKISENQNEHLKSQRHILSKDSSITASKQLVTATTIHVEDNINFKDTDIKQTQFKGLDMWALNKNLKQFSQTRKVAFFKANPQKSRNQISSTVSKNKTAQIKSMQKIYGGDAGRGFDPEKEKSQTDRKFSKINQNMIKRKHSQIQPHPYSTFSKTKIPSPLGNTLYGTLPVRKQVSELNTTLNMKQKKILSEHKLKDLQTLPSDINPYLRTFINGSHLKRSPSNRKLQILELKNFTPKATQNLNFVEKNNQKKPTNFRRNRFEKILTEQNSGAESQKLLEKDLLDSKEFMKEKQLKTSKEELLQILNDDRQMISSQKLIRGDKYRQAQEKKRLFQHHRLVEKINKTLLKNTEDYFNNYQTFSVLPLSKIQFCIDSINYPEVNNNTIEYKSKYQGQYGSQLKDQFSFAEPYQLSKKQKGKSNHKNKNKQTKKQKLNQKN